MDFDPEQQKEIEKLTSRGFTALQAYQLYYLAKEYRKPDRGKWKNNT